MKHWPALVGALILILALAARAAGPDDQYIAIYYLIQQGDAARDSGKITDAVARYTDAQTALQKLQHTYPAWQTNIVSYRLSYLASRLAQLPQGTPSPKAAPQTAVVPPGSPELEKQMSALQNQVQSLEQNNQTLQAKLREALSVRPAAADPAAVAQAEARIQELTKENALLRANLGDARTNAAAAQNARQLADLRKDLEETSQKLAAETARAKDLAQEKDDLQKRLKNTAASPRDTELLRQTQRKLNDAAQALNEQKAQSEQLSRDKAALTARLQSFESEMAKAAALRAENDLLRRQAAQLQASSDANVVNDLQHRLSAAELQIAALKSERDVLKLERSALEGRVKQLLAEAKANSTLNTARAEDTERIHTLEQDRTTLQRQLAAAIRELSRRGTTGSVAHADELATQLSELRAKLQVYEAKPVPYSAEELALFRETPPRLAETDQPVRKTIPKPPPGTASLVVEAQRLFAHGEFSKAEEKYQQVLRKDEKNVYTLANLAAIQLEQGHLDDAKKNLRTALSIAPDDAYSLEMLGNVYFRQGNYDDALAVLSRAAQLDPQNPEVQNYLGVTLSHKGQRQAAENALRRAVQLEPNYGSAHNNLAVIYASQDPPLVELARWHYKKALEAGHPKNPELEKFFEERAKTASSQ